MAMAVIREQERKIGHKWYYSAQSDAEHREQMACLETRAGLEQEVASHRGVGVNEEGLSALPVGE